MKQYTAKCHKCDFVAESSFSQELADRYVVEHFLKEHPGGKIVVK